MEFVFKRLCLKPRVSAARALASIAALALASGGLSACSSSPAKPQAKAAATTSDATTSATSAKDGGTDEVMKKTGFKKLALAAVALQAVFDRSLSEPGEDPGMSVVGCPVSGKQAQAWLNAVHGMLDEQAADERNQYLVNPVAYSGKFNSCAANCLCSAYAMIVGERQPADETEEPFQKEALTKLRRKASELGPLANLDCGRAQTWFCDSDLKAYLDKLPN